jgi:hypothetical protein
VLAVVTDGVVAPAPPQPARRLLVLGDSLSAGPGAGFTVPPSGAPCGDGVLLNDWANTWNALLCKNFSAACEVIAGSGQTITGKPYNIPMSYPFALGAMGEPAVPVDAWLHRADPGSKEMMVAEPTMSLDRHAVGQRSVQQRFASELTPRHEITDGHRKE